MERTFPKSTACWSYWHRWCTYRSSDLAKPVTTVSYSHSLSCPRLCFLGVCCCLFGVWMNMSVGAVVIKYYKNTFTRRKKKSVRIIYAICNPGRGVGVVWSLLQRIHGVQKSQGPGVPKTDRWRLRSAPADKKGFKEGQATCCAPPWGLGRAASASTGSHSSRSPGSRWLPAAGAEWGSVPGLSRLQTGGDQHLCAASANCARWKSAASRRISSQASAIAVPLAPTQGNGRHVSPQSAAGAQGRAAPRAKTPARTQNRERRRGGHAGRPRLGVASGRRRRTASKPG